MADYARGVGKGIDTEGVSLVGNVVFCDRAKCMGDFDINSERSHGKCNVLGVPDEGMDAIEIVDEELSDSLVHRERTPNPTLIRLGLVAIGAAEILLEPFVGSKFRAKVHERMYGA
jgi:hypothetical protein